MNIAQLSPKLSDIGLPVFWQVYILLHGIAVLGYSFISSGVWSLFIYAGLSLLVTIGMSYGIWVQHRNALYPWVVLLLGEAIITTAIILKAFIGAGFSLDDAIPFWVESAGIGLIGLFGFSVMHIFEKRYELRGFALDFVLLVMSLICLIVLVSPNLLNTFVYEFTLVQKINIFQAMFAGALFVMAVLYQLIRKRVGLRESVLVCLVALIELHFISETVLSFDLVENRALLQDISNIFYKLAGSLAIVFVFIERFLTLHSTHVSLCVSGHFMWAASVIAILVVPIGVIIRWALGMPPIDLLFIGLSSFLLSSVVIWRFFILVKNAEEQRKKLASITHTDQLTGLHNYLGYLDGLSELKLSNVVVFSVNIEDFKSINDLYGIHFGDEVLQSLGKRLGKIPDVSLVARTSVDLFLLVFDMPKDRVAYQADYIHDTLGAWDVVSGRRIAVPLTLGASTSQYRVEPEKYARQAEQALKIARKRTLGFYLYSDENHDRELPRHELREILQKAIDDKHLPVHFQPIYNLSDGSLKALEMLIRVESVEHGVLLPGQFLDQAKSYGLLTALTHVCVYMISRHYSELPDVTINVNLPPYMLNNTKILDEFINCFKDENLPPEKFCIEVTEDGDIPYEHLIPAVETLKKQGFAIAMDDFGTGYSSLARLSALPVDIVKIDRSLLLTADAGNQAALDCAITLVKRLGVSAVVEGVETLEQLTLIKLMGADSVQGFLLSRPVPISKASEIRMTVEGVREVGLS